MHLPTECFSTTFQRRLKQYAYNLLRPSKFPLSSYDNDRFSLSEEIVQEAYYRIYEKPEDGQPRTEIQWLVYFYGFIKNIAREEGRRVFRRERHLGRKVVASVYATETDPASLAQEPTADSSASDIHQEYENRELERIVAEELARFPPDPFFAHFAGRQLFEGETGRSVWDERYIDGYSDNQLRGLSTYFRWYQKLLLAVLKRWGQPIGEEVNRHVQR